MSKTTMSVLGVFLLLSVFVQLNDAKKFSKCEVARIMANSGLFDHLPDWMCLINAESSFYSDARGENDGSYDYGLFQFNSNSWCGIGRVGGDCNTACEDYLDDDITDDIVCADKVYRRHGFGGWYGWKKNCNDTDSIKPSVDDCF